MKRIDSDLIVSIAGAGIPAVFGIMMVPIVVRNIGFENYGILTIMSIMAASMQLLDFGFGKAIINKIASGNVDKQIETEYLANGVKFSFLVGVFLSLIGTLGLLLSLKPEYGVKANWSLVGLIFIICGPIVACTNIIQSYNESKGNFKIVALRKSILGIIQYTLMVIAALLFKGDAVLPVCILIMLIKALYPVSLFPFKTMNFNGLTINISKVRELWKFGKWVFVVAIIGPLLQLFPKYTLGLIAGSDELGKYGSIYDMCIGVLIWESIIMSVLYPRLVRSMGITDANATRSLYHKILIAISAPIGLIAIVVIYCSEFLINIWVGSEYLHTLSQILQLMIFGVFVNSFGQVAQGVIYASGNSKLPAKIQLVELIFFIPYAIFFIWKYGAIGGAFSWVIRVTLSTITLLYFGQKCLKGANAN